MRTALTKYAGAWIQILGLGLAVTTHAQGTAFQYQGRLNQSGSPAAGLFDFRFSVFDSSSGGAPVGGSVTQAGVPVSNGVFNVALNFGAGVFTGPARWLEVGVKPAGSATYTNLAPRQSVLPSPYSIHANSASSVAGGSVVKSLNNLRDDITLAAGANVTLTPNGNTLTIASSGGGSSPWAINGANLYYNGGSVGIGTTTPAAALELNSFNGNALLYATAPRPTLILRDTIAANARGVIGGFNGGLRFYTESFWSGGNSSAFMALETNGNLGLGTPSPQSRMHIAGVADAIRLTGGHPYITFEDTAAGLYSRVQAEGAGVKLVSQGAASGSNPGGYFILTGVGYAGIGTTDPHHSLRIVGSPSWTANFWGGAIELENASAIGWHENAGGWRFGMGHTTGGFYMFRTIDEPGSTGTPVIYDFTLTDAGNVGLGTGTPANKLTLLTSTANYGLEHTDGNVRLSTYVGGSTGGGWLGTISNHKLSFFVNNGSASMTVDTGGNVGIGTTTPAAKLDVAGTTRTRVLTITGGSDIAEPFQLSSKELPKGSVVVIDEQEPGNLKLSTEAYDTRVAGVLSGANGINPGISLRQEGALDSGENVALSGRVYVRADADSGAIKPGDLLTTSGTPGHAMKARDHVRAQGAILGKAMTGLKEGRGMVLVLVTLQ